MSLETHVTVAEGMAIKADMPSAHTAAANRISFGLFFDVIAVSFGGHSKDNPASFGSSIIRPSGDEKTRGAWAIWRGRGGHRGACYGQP